ncbi:uncharacterized protein LOC131598090 [Vicia villosa]|uniref:uncharacterized protein LOC131598090 n=1 Tax=Vicia villosa TaxID=3911 RepID=UPI00273CEB7D|nr:uncharacterized protein LOC131598090 [Vicia villosa]
MQILDGILIANEIVDEARRKKKEVLMFKVNFEKAYDSEDWSFLDYVMSKMGLNIHDKWLEEASKLLKCQKGSIPFKYLGLPIGDNPNRINTWQPVIEAVRKVEMENQIGKTRIVVKCVEEKIWGGRGHEEHNIGDWESSKYYYVKGVYKGLAYFELDHYVDAWPKIWHKAIPSKISCFGWRLFQNSLANKNNLYRRNVNGKGSIRCIGGCDTVESIPHLFFECLYFSGIWKFVCKWLRISTALHGDSIAHLAQFEGLIGGDKEISSKVRVIWLACCWSIWKARNAKIFNNKEVETKKIIEDSIEYSWRWLSSVNADVQYNYAQWRTNPRPCLDLES